MLGEVRLLVWAHSATTADAELLASAVALRWSRPDLTAAVAEHVAATWAADDRAWVAAAGWLVHGKAAVGDGRECASDTLAELVGRDPALLDEPAADRLRIEVAALAAAQCEPAVARLLVEPLGSDRPAEVRADALAVLARCAFEDRPAAVGEATRRAADAWAAVRGADGEIAVAALTLLSGSAARRAGRPDTAVDHAAEGLARLDDLRPGASAPHLTAALAAEWITALVEAGRTDDARAGCDAVAEHLVSTARPTRQRALLRLTVARALAASASPGAFEALEQAAADASACDAPDLEGLCLSTLGTLREQAGRLDAALESMRRGLAAQRRDRARSERFRAALRELSLLPSGVATPVSSTGRRDAMVPSQVTRALSRRMADHAGEAHPLTANPWITGSWTAGGWTTDVTPSPDRRSRQAAAAPRPGRGTAAEPPDVDGGSAGLPAMRSEPGVGSDAGQDVDDTASDPPFGPLDGIVEQGVDGGSSGGPTAAPEPASTAPSAATAPVAERFVQDSESWLASALAELDRVWGSPLPELGSVNDRPDEPSTAESTAANSSDTPTADAMASAAGTPHGAPASAGGVLDGHAEDEQLMSPWAAWTDEQVASPSNAAERAIDAGCDAPAVHVVDEVVGPSDFADRPPVVGCVVVVDVVCAGVPVPEGVALLSGLVRRLADRIPSGARMRIDEGESTLSVVLPGQDRFVAASWMHRALPAVFHDASATDDHELLPVGSALRAAVHDTDGPVGAQLLQRLDRVRVSRDPTPPVPVRWGVPIAPGSGGRRRAADVGGVAPVGPGGADRGRHHQGPDGSLAVAPGEATDSATDSADAAHRPCADNVRARRSEANGAAAGLAAAPAAGAGEVHPSSDDTELSVEGLGLADLLAGALAAYRAI